MSNMQEQLGLSDDLITMLLEVFMEDQDISESSKYNEAELLEEEAEWNETVDQLLAAKEKLKAIRESSYE